MFILQLPSFKEWQCFKVWDSTLFEKEETETSTMEFKHKADVDGEGTRALMYPSCSNTLLKTLQPLNSKRFELLEP